MRVSKDGRNTLPRGHPSRRIASAMLLRMRSEMALRPPSKGNLQSPRRLPSGDRDGDRRRFAVEPVLLVGQREPGIFHALVAQIARMVVRVFRETLTVFSIFAKVI